MATIPRFALLSVWLAAASVGEVGAQDGATVTDIEYEGWRQAGRPRTRERSRPS